jgi:tetrahydromethanopterin S-methyltransferase subunit G
MSDYIFKTGDSPSKPDKRELYPLFDQNSRPILPNQEAANLSIEIGKIQNRLDSIERKKYIYWSWKIFSPFFAILASGLAVWWKVSVYVAERPYETAQKRIDDLVKEVQILRCKNNILSDCYRQKCSSQDVNQMKNNCETITK